MLLAYVRHRRNTADTPSRNNSEERVIGVLLTLHRLSLYE